MTMSRTVWLLLAIAALAPGTPVEGQQTTRIRSVARERVAVARAERYQGRNEREEQTERFTKTLKIGANGELSVANIAGDIVISRSNGNEATVEVVKTARGQTVEDARQLLQLVQVEVIERAGRGEIKTRYPQGDEMRRNNRRNMNVSVAYTIAAPVNTRITARSISGSIKARELKGDLSLESVSGTIQILDGARVTSAKSISGNVEIANTNAQGPLEASSVSGTVTLRKVKAGRLDLGSVSGDVVVEDVESERAEVQSVSGNVRYVGPLAHGGRYDLTSHSGEVRLMIAGETGFEVEATSFSGSVRSDFPLKVGGNEGDRGRGRRQRSLRGVYGDGSAVLDLTTFSGSIVISRK